MNVDQVPEWLPSFLVPFITLSYPIPPPVAPDSFENSNYYSTGILDGCFIVTCIAVMAVLRDITRIFVLEPFAQWYLTRQAKKLSKPLKDLKQNGSANGHSNGHSNGCANGKSNGHANGLTNGHNGVANGCNGKTTGKIERKIHRSVLRFAEQGWSVVYYSCQWSYGLYVHWNLPTAPFNPSRLWLNYPHVDLAGPLKFYYLTQTAFYLHQILILNAEARRKDHVQMMTHHIITVALMVASYFYNFTRVGCLIMVLMDCCDIWLPLAKMLRYLSLLRLCDMTFALFTVSWLITRHYFFVQVIWSAYHDAPRLIPFDWAPERGHYLTHGTFMAFIGMLVSLQFLQILWFQMILSVVWRVVSGQGAEDTRSDDEGDDDEPSHELEDTKTRMIPEQTDSKKSR